MATIPLPTVPPDADVYIDANILIHAMLGKSAECRAFVGRCGTDINGYSDVKVLHDTMHKLMCAEAGVGAKNLKKNPALIKSLTKWQNHASVVRRLPIEWIDMHKTSVDQFPNRASSLGLLCGDSLITVLMNEYGIRAIASDDSDFDNLGVTVYEPSDL